LNPQSAISLTNFEDRLASFSNYSFKAERFVVTGDPLEKSQKIPSLLVGEGRTFARNSGIAAQVLSTVFMDCGCIPAIGDYNSTYCRESTRTMRSGAALFI
jgi:hypothetical protein